MHKGDVQTPLRRAAIQTRSLLAVEQHQAVQTPVQQIQEFIIYKKGYLFLLRYFTQKMEEIAKHWI